ncbi:nucleotidyltransferase domain-containing protein [Terribacillus aidingensis]|uniref:nucleotidyltransferase domain-containing protein n=1 Tax=Terribacillus aidingensis TaxID=586416 RepID=UPI000BE31E64|nr:nucleotidyltransferase domain-containing protein [Terribacillus aidingensis]
MRDSLETAKRYIEMNHPECNGAMLAGSCARGEATATSDLDIIILYTGKDSAYRESLFYEDWPVEVFVYTGDAYHKFFHNDAARAIPSLPRMASEGIVLKDAEALVVKMKEEAKEVLA